MMENSPSSVIPIPGAGPLRGIGDPSPNRSRRPRSRRDRDKRFVCDHEGCDKTYTRAEHLTRHQLNHQGAYKYLCRVDPRCGKRFVRGDLLSRHEERHQNRKIKHGLSDEGGSPPARIAPSTSAGASPTSDLANNFTRAINIPMSSPDYDPGDYERSEGDDRGSGPLSSPDEMSIDSGYHYQGHTPNPRQTFAQNYNGSNQYAQPVSNSPSFGAGFVPINQNYSAQPILDQSQRGYQVQSLGPEPLRISPGGPSPPYENPMFASFFTNQDGLFLGDGSNLNGDQSNWMDLYNPVTSWPDGTSGLESQYEMQPVYSSQGAADNMIFGTEGGRRGSVYYPPGVPLGALLNDGSGSYHNAPIITTEIRNRIITRHLKWNLDDRRVIMHQQSLTPEALSDYITVYWQQFHTQYPILHRPTTVINNNAHLPLFIVMITIGMSLGGDVNAHNLAVEMHEELRWEIYSSKQFRHPAKLWEMQTLLLREIFDKMLCTRHQHEMSHTFHGALLTLMRRGTTLDGFLYREGGKQDDTSKDAPGQLSRRWHDWVELECTKRVAYLAFIIDSQHAMMFGHALVLSAQELNLRHPCKEDLWAAQSPVEWQRAEQRFPEVQGEPGFLDTLKVFLNEPGAAKDKITLDPFGSFVVLHGLISVAWHMQQKSQGSLGVSTSSHSRATSPTPNSTREYWKLVLERSLNAWRNSMHGNSTANPSTVKFNRSSMTLYRIAHVTLYTNIIDLQILAGLPKIMGKPVKQDLATTVWIRMSSSWAGSEGAAKAVQHALKLLNETLFSRPNLDYLTARQQRPGNLDGGYGQFQRMDHALDGVMHGKWCLYLATLTLWAWGVVTSNDSSREGSVAMNGMSTFGSNVKMEDSEMVSFSEYSVDDEVTAWHHAHRYLQKMGAVTDRNTLSTMAVRTETRGLVITIRNLLANERWELLQEGAKLCTKILNGHHRGRNPSSDDSIASPYDEKRRMQI